MQLTLIFTTLVTFAAIAASHPTPKLVKARTSLAKPQLDPGFTAFTGLSMPDTPDSIDFEDTLVSPRRSLNFDASGEADRNDDIDNDIHKRSFRDSKSSVSHSTNERDGDDGGDEGREAGGDDDRRRKDVESHLVHERKAFVYRLKDEKPYN